MAISQKQNCDNISSPRSFLTYMSYQGLPRTRDSAAGRSICCSLGFGPIGNDEVQSAKLL